MFKVTLICAHCCSCATHTAPGNPVESLQSDDDLETPEVFPILCGVCSQWFAGRTSKAKTIATVTYYNQLQNIVYAVALTVTTTTKTSGITSKEWQL